MATFAYPPRKLSDPRAYSRSPRSRTLQRARLRYIGVVAALFIFGIWLVTRLFSSESAPRIPFGSPTAVIVTAINNETMSKQYIQAIKENRRDYADRHGYATFFPNVTDYELRSSPLSWSRVPAMRHAMTLYPYSEWFFYLSPSALIMKPAMSLDTHITSSSRLEELMLVDKPVVPPDSVIHTFEHLKGEKVDLVLTQDQEGLGVDSFVVRRGEWAKFFLDAWFDPLYRSYNFQKAEGHALEHIVQWHGTMLAKLVLVPQRILNSYVGDSAAAQVADDADYGEGDFIANFVGCEEDTERDCFDEMGPLLNRWREIRDHGAQ